jgi:hypothetical protein
MESGGFPKIAQRAIDAFLATAYQSCSSLGYALGAFGSFPKDKDRFTEADGLLLDPSAIGHAQI